MQEVNRTWTWMFLAWLVALVATMGAVFVGEIMGQAPCVLCWYQRIAMFPLVVILGVGVFIGDRSAVLYSLPLALAGAGLATFHVLLFYKIVPEAVQPCSAGPSCSDEAMVLFGLMPLPVLSLMAFAAIVVLLAPFHRSRHP